ncbi:transcriptional regulator, TrmB (plasmid) [Methanohalobium evestigatum Z-7303]|uniref:Transcriptional regulator, TrmB n=1 Tax=Methanohalobium evestigatum (strain ATCC BAA-1072 / DSM 3721 / NBRC 107634 / OCM 161 / Z-7303) TaxID=644295 RepID=D7EC62_METEZ|nr:MarR family transcriptional regulator [Methanohalobium evestigatum]ADI75184.1 transcriptional regulator, TrmB [Methanohalobium evestigatum Z-7303]
MREYKPPLDSKKIEMSEILKNLGLTRTVSMTLACLSDGQELSSKEIETISGLRQPEVSSATKYLIEKGWIEIREEKITTNKGRPTKLYTLVAPIDKITKDIEADILSQNRNILDNIEYLKDFVDNPQKI